MFRLIFLKVKCNIVLGEFFVSLMMAKFVTFINSK